MKEPEKKPEKKYEWRPASDGSVLVEIVEYDQSDSMPQLEETILGGCQYVDDYICGYVMRNGVQLALVTRFNPALAKDDVITRLREMGYSIDYEQPIQA